MLRPALAEDLPAIVAIDQGNDGVGLLPSLYAELLPCAADGKGGEGGKGLLLVAETDGEHIAGFSACSQVLDEATLLALVVEPTRRGSGLGTALLAASVEALAAAGATRCLLEVRASNAAGLALYAAAGFREDGRRRGYYPGAGTLEREDAVLMSRELERE
ncbi:Ribosomal-protein-S18p-alanine acetyltransferase [Pseudohaliea rubra DSM 19751]|uniref:Ribosomal-protein-S18p-alanine acetyltransferase n=1 Tax=Pseudohaliea rubra DSM 19751 TaxID=1265313 RepID=A0A095VUX4_9GAMM|nr:Ribosomal-protein-S18p-alanine acetyltransferase [Pseudohaliea rubra DSM 19751]